MLKQGDAKDPLFNTPTVLTLHNLEHQGIFPPDVAKFAGMSDKDSEEINSFVVHLLPKGTIQILLFLPVKKTESRKLF